MPEAIDVVYTWVDDRFEGYADILRRYASGARDPGPHRNDPDLLRYSLRSLARNLPWVRDVYLLTMRPQVPSWLAADHPRIKVVHHDQIMDAAILPTFNPFAVASHIHLLPNLSRRFLYIDGGMVVLWRCTLRDLEDETGRVRVFEGGARTPTYGRINPKKGRPLDLALAEANHLLDERYGKRRPRGVNRAPLLIDRALFAEMLAAWPKATAATRASRFPSAGNIPPAYLYPHIQLSEGRGVPATPMQMKWQIGHLSPGHFYPWAAWRLAAIRRCHPQFVTVSDAFGRASRPAVERLIKRQLDTWFPEPCEFERT